LQSTSIDNCKSNLKKPKKQLINQQLVAVSNIVQVSLSF